MTKHNTDLFLYYTNTTAKLWILQSWHYVMHASKALQLLLSWREVVLCHLCSDIGNSCTFTSAKKMTPRIHTSFASLEIKSLSCTKKKHFFLHIWLENNSEVNTILLQHYFNPDFIIHLQRRAVAVGKTTWGSDCRTKQVR